jgi:hypothetical protein
MICFFRGRIMMKSIILIFLALSFGTLIDLNAGGVSYSFKVVELVLGIIFGLLCINSYKTGVAIKLTTFDKVRYLLWIICLMYSILTYFWSSQSITVLAGSIALSYGVISNFVADYFIGKDPKIFIKANRIFILSLFIQLGINMISMFSSYGLNFYQLKDNSSTLIGNSNYIAIYFTFTFLYELIAKNKRWMFYSVISLIAVILSISRGAIISTVICLSVYVLFVIFNPRIKKFKIFFSLGVLGMLFYLFINYTTPGITLMMGLSDGLQAHSIITRQVLWNEATNQIQDQPFGNGFVWILDPHNIVLSSLRNLGVVVGPIYLFLIGYPLLYFFRLRTYKLSQQSLAILIAYSSVFIHSMIEVFYGSSTAIIWTIMALSFLNHEIRLEMNTIKEKTVKKDVNGSFVNQKQKLA